MESESVSHSVLSDSSQSYGCNPPWDSPGEGENIQKPQEVAFGEDSFDACTVVQ